MIDTIVLEKSLAGEWDKILITLFQQYQNTGEERERQRLKRIIEGDLSQMLAEGYPLPIVSLYESCFQNMLQK